MKQGIRLGQNLRLYREKYGMTQKQLADRIGYTEKSISKWENNRGMPTLDVAVQLAAFFGVSMDEMVLRKTAERYALGIDGGGTKTEFKLEDEAGQTVRTVCKGPSNPNDIGIEQTIALLDAGIREVCRDIPYGCISMYAGISGGGLTGTHAQTLHRQFKKYGFWAFGNGSDIENLAALAGNDKCVLVIMGTGFIAFAVDGTQRHRVAGWGQFFDEGGSGYSLGRDAVCAALRATDGSGKQTLLCDMIEKRLGETVEAHVGAFYYEGKKGIAAMADLVFAAAEQGDAAAREILDKNMAFVAEMIDAAMRHLPAGKVTPVYFSGGVSTRHDVLFPLIDRHLQNDNCRLVHLEKEPVDGAVLHARQLIQSER